MSAQVSGTDDGRFWLGAVPGAVLGAGIFTVLVWLGGKAGIGLGVLDFHHFAFGVVAHAIGAGFLGGVAALCWPWGRRC